MGQECWSFDAVELKYCKNKISLNLSFVSHPLFLLTLAQEGWITDIVIQQNNMTNLGRV